MFQIQVFYNDEYELTFFVKDLCAASIIMTSITNDSVNSSFEIKSVRKEDI